MFFYLKVSSKDNKLLEKFIQFLLKSETSPTILKYFAKQNKRKFVSILKSPHVNKTAQEQFEFRYYRKQFIISSLKPLSYFLTLKKITNKSFPGIKFEVKGLFSKSKKNKIINPNDVISQNKYNLKVGEQFKLFQTKYIQSFDCYGEICLSNTFFSKNIF